MKVLGMGQGKDVGCVLDNKDDVIKIVGVMHHRDKSRFLPAAKVGEG